MTGTMELSDQDILDLNTALDITIGLKAYPELEARLADLKERLLKVEVNSV